VDVTFGRNVIIVEPVNLYGCSIGDDTFVGPFVEIQRGASVGRRCRIQSHSFICDMVAIGDDCTVSHGVMFVNDLFSTGGPARGDRSKWAATRIGNSVSIGSNATLLPVSVVDGCVIGAGAVVTRDCVVRGVYAGSPARLQRELK
jgi:acetyltransferase-like isoleucine patch superfamily enzyme